MSLNTISTEFEAAFNQKKRIRPTAPPDRPLQYRYTFYPLQCLAELSEQVKTKASKNRAYNTLDDEFLPNYAVRFVVAIDYQILFSFEGPRSKSVPAHSDIVSPVLTAGNIYFSSDYSQIVQITNKSGHFKPSFGSLVFAIPLILRSGFPLAPLICLSDEVTKQEEKFTVEQLASLIPKIVQESELLERNSSSEIMISSNLTDRASESACEMPSPKRKLPKLFFSDASDVSDVSVVSDDSTPEVDAHQSGYSTP